MITVINKANKSLYNQLFADVQEWLYKHDQQGRELTEKYGEGALLGLVEEKIKDPDTGEIIETGNMVPDTITSLEELFQYMYFITNFTPIYTRLPLDEEPFFIDANKRSISVPRDFASNGVSVQGDEVSEILFFKINRFFDATDLSECDIFIQWKSSETDENGNFKEGVSKPWIQDIVSEPGYLIFGWPISSRITKVAGTVTFSVRFYRLDESDQLIYSFSTLDQTVKIQPALDFDIVDIVNDSHQYVIDDAVANITNRAINSPISSGDTIAEKPEWEEGIEEGLQSDVIVYKEDGTVRFYVMNLGINEETLFSDQPLVLKIAAISSDSGVVSYIWKKVDKDGNGKLYCADGVTKFYNPVEYIVTDTLDANRVEGKPYYYKEDDRFKAIPPASSENPTPFADLRAADKEIYELVSTAILDEVGRYTATAQNRVGKVFSEALIAPSIYVPQPVEPELGDLTASDSPILDEDIVTLSIPVALADEFGNDVSNTGGKATYVWHRRPLGSATAEDLADTGATLILTPNEGEVEDLEGWYSVTVTNNLNKEAETSISGEIRITKPAAKAVLTIDADDDLSYAEALQRHLNVYVANLEADGIREEELGDSISYQWYMYNSTGHAPENDMALAREGMYADDTGGVYGDDKIEDLVTTLGEDLVTRAVIDSSKTASFIPPASTEATYFCVVTNNYNGTTRSVASPFYHVTR